ncbi:hypothetical protein P12x_002005 [Tundrisphaera lichenicola]|uniref:hypothetical protein n=1 Tax=Tundrisphaera lichenicola TaxID=2029860 RepID=UPI003EB85CE9
MPRIKPRSRPVVDTLEERVVLSTLRTLTPTATPSAVMATTRTLPKIPVETTAPESSSATPTTTTRSLQKVQALATASSTVSLPRATTIRSLPTLSTNRANAVQVGSTRTVKLSKTMALASQVQAYRSNLSAATTRVLGSNGAGRQATSFKVGLNASTFKPAITVSSTARIPVATNVARLGK